MTAPHGSGDVATTELVDAANGTTIAQTQLTLNPNMGPLEGRAYCDTIVGYAAPRMAALLGLAYAVQAAPLHRHATMIQMPQSWMTHAFTPAFHVMMEMK